VPLKFHANSACRPACQARQRALALQGVGSTTWAAGDTVSAVGRLARFHVARAGHSTIFRPLLSHDSSVLDWPGHATAQQRPLITQPSLVPDSCGWRFSERAVAGVLYEVGDVRAARRSTKRLRWGLALPTGVARGMMFCVHSVESRAPVFTWRARRGWHERVDACWNSTRDAAATWMRPTR